MPDEDVEYFSLSPSLDLDLYPLAGFLAAEESANVLRSETHRGFPRQGQHPVARVQPLARAIIALAGKCPGDDEGGQPVELEKFCSEAELSPGASPAGSLEVGGREEGRKVELVDKGLEGFSGEGLHVDRSGIDELPADHLDEFFQCVALHLAAFDLQAPDAPGELLVFALQLFELDDEVRRLAVEARRALEEEPGEGAALARLAAELPDESEDDGIERSARTHAGDREGCLRAELEASPAIVDQAQERLA